MDLDHILNHLGEDRSQYLGAVSPPIFQTSNFAFPDVASFRDAFTDERKNHIYTRGNNPTVEILRKKMAALEKTEDALLFSSGIAAVSAAILSQISSGAHVVCVLNPYSWTKHLLENWVARFHVKTTFVKADDTQGILDACKQETRIIYLESPNTMTFEVQDLRKVASFARSRNITTIIDNSHCSPVFQNPSEFGIDLIVHSVTKYISGHSDIVAGAVCGKKDLIDKIFDNEYMTLGAILSPNSAAMILKGLRTLPLRVQRSHDSSVIIAKWLSAHPKVKKVIHPWLVDFPQHELVKSQMRGAGGLFSFELKTDSIEACENFANRLERFLMAVSWGGHESLVIPICAFYNEDINEKPHLPYQFFRLYIGLEDPEVLIADLEKALEIV